MVPETDQTFDLQFYDLFLLTSEQGGLDQDSIPVLIQNSRDLVSRTGLVVQFFDADRIHGREQVISALYHALRSGADGRSRTRDISVDITRYTAGDRQINNAFDSVGLREGTKQVLCFVFYPRRVRMMMKDQDQNKPFEEELHALFREHHLIPIQDIPANNGLERNRKDLLDVLEKMALVDLKL